MEIDQEESCIEFVKVIINTPLDETATITLRCGLKFR